VNLADRPDCRVCAWTLQFAVPVNIHRRIVASTTRRTREPNSLYPLIGTADRIAAWSGSALNAA
jgi:hypothetical protein